MDRARIERAARALACLGPLTAVVLALAWADVLPGGWRLRGSVEAHAVREARERALHLAARCREFAAEPRDEAGPRVVFLGSSTIERCDLGRAFPGLEAANRGVGGARARELADRLDALLAGAEPRAIVLYAGGPDRVLAPLDVEGAVASVEVLARGVRERAAGVPVLLLGLLPTTSSTAPELDALARIDAGIARSADELGCAHLTLRDSGLAGPDGRLREDLSSDGLHLRPEGYAVFAARLRAAPEPFRDLLAL